MQENYPEIQVNEYEVTGDKKGWELMKKIGKELEADTSGVPFTVIERDYVSGWYNRATTGELIKDKVLENCDILIKEEAYKSGVAEDEYDFEKSNQDSSNQKLKKDRKDKTINSVAPNIEKIDLPVLGKIDLSQYSLPVVTIIMGALDGFNPCAMWILLFLISILIGVKDRKRMWLLGGIFIVASAFVYFIFMSAWLNILLFLSFVVWVRLAVGLFAVIGGSFNLREFFRQKRGTCHVVDKQKRKKIFSRIIEISKEKKLWVAIIGIIFLAFSVNLIELLCSAGFPAIYTQLLSLNQIPTHQYYLYLLLYVFFFMLDDLMIFIIAMTTLKMVGFSTKYSRFNHLIGGVLMIIIGLLMIIKPDVLMFD
ncbi:MAG: hypothetical protein GF335_04400 [Candidatus Moranbacteria bacterium]|nr:hypothetical protein [Candidatus Moranbacteria bacterium]